MMAVALFGVVLSFLFWDSFGVRKFVFLFLFDSVFLLVVLRLFGPLVVVSSVFLVLFNLMWGVLWK